VNTRTRILVAAIALLVAAWPAPAAVVEEIVAKVNNRIISKTEFEERSTFVLGQIYQEFSGAELDARLKEAQDTMLANMITELLLLERAEVLLDLEKVRKNLIEDFRKQEGIATEEDLDRLLREQNMTRADLEEQLLRLSVPQEIVNYEVRRRISVSDEEIKKYYESHPKDWEVAPTATFREIVLIYDPKTAGAARDRAQAILAEIKDGADFLELVQRHSESGSRDSGGLLGPLTPADLNPAIAEQTFGHEPGEVTDAIDTGRSIHIIKIEAKAPRIVKTLDETRDLVANRIRQEKFQPRYLKYLRRLWRESQIEIRPNYEHYLIVSPLKTAS
jgi:parvulin-like peptidyl-prolyl isomerase